jgi:hypothetical protein
LQLPRNSQPHPITAADIILNLKNPVNGDRIDSIHLPIPTRWYFPDDPAIDLAVLPFATPDKYDAEALPMNIFLTSDLWQPLSVQTGDRLLTVGFFRLYTGTHRFQPMMRQGSLAMIPDDAIQLPCGGSGKIYLADVHIISGNSGSPIFLGFRMSLGGLAGPPGGGSPYGLLGVVSGYMYEDSDLTLRTSTDYEAVIHANSGIAMVVPADQLKALLYSAPLQQLRDQAVAAPNPKKE